MTKKNRLLCIFIPGLFEPRNYCRWAPFGRHSECFSLPQRDTNKECPCQMKVQSLRARSRLSLFTALHPFNMVALAAICDQESNTAPWQGAAMGSPDKLAVPGGHLDLFNLGYSKNLSTGCPSWEKGALFSTLYSCCKPTQLVFFKYDRAKHQPHKEISQLCLPVVAQDDSSSK